MLTGATLVTLPLAWVTEGPLTLNLQPVTVAAIAYYAIIATAGAYLLYYRVLAVAGSGNLMLVTLLIPPVAIILGHLVRDEVLAPHAYGGFALLTAGLIILDGRVWNWLRSRPRIDRAEPHR
jgi:drug/metabolite transporter (DMT)-like permease